MSSWNEVQVCLLVAALLPRVRDIRRIEGISDTHASSTQLVDALTRNPDSPWNACDYGAKLTPRGLAKRLARFASR